MSRREKEVPLDQQNPLPLKQVPDGKLHLLAIIK
jgi:hypothetical protein